MEPIIVFAEKGGEWYRSLPLPDASIAVYPPDQFYPVIDFEIGLAIIDCGPAAETGLRLLVEFKQRRPDVPVIFITDASSEEVAIKAFKAGARDYFRRPLLPGELAKAVETIIRFKRDIMHHASSAMAGRRDDSATVRLVADLPLQIARSLRYIEANLCRDICLDNLAREACMSKYHFCRTFKHHVGLSPLQYLSSRRIERVKQLLNRSEQSICSAAYNSGFSDISGFIRTFRKFTGTTPSVYKDSHRSGKS